MREMRTQDVSSERIREFRRDCRARGRAGLAGAVEYVCRMDAAQLCVEPGERLVLSMKTRIRKANIVLLLLVLMGVVAGLASPGNSDNNPDALGMGLHLPVILSFAVCYGLLLSAIFIRPRVVMRAILGVKPMWILVAFCILSAAWSSDPSLTLRRALMLSITVLVGALIGSEFDVPTLAKMLGWATLIHIALSLAMLKIAPHMLFSWDTPNDMRGLTTHKNIFGLDMGLGVISLLLVPLGRRMRHLRAPFAALAFFMLLWSHSAGALVSTLAALVVLCIMPIARVKGLQKAPFLAVAAGLIAAIGVVLKQNAELLPGLLQKDTTLTGRTELWDLLITAIKNRPLLGYGFDTFWQGLHGDSLSIIRGVGWLVPTAHNGYLELLISLGIVGALIFLPLLLQAIRLAWLYAGIDRAASGLFPAAFLVLWLVYNMSESTLLTRNGIPMLLFVMLTASMRKALTARKRVEASEYAGEAVPLQTPPPTPAGEATGEAWREPDLQWVSGPAA